MLRSLVNTHAVWGLVLSAALLAGCGAATTASQEPGQVDLGHVHGLGLDPASGDLFIASHLGVYQMSGTGKPRLIANRRQDTMAFTVIGPRTFLASGHPDPAVGGQPAHLGLIESRDAARTWKTRSLAGTADFHALENTSAGLYGYDSQSGALMFSTNRTDWRQLLRAQILDISASPADPGDVLVTTEQGIQPLRRNQLGAALPNSGGVALIERPNLTGIVAATPDATVLVSDDDARTWKSSTKLGGDIQALNAEGDTWYAATTEAIYTSDDSGQTWSPIVELRR